MANRHTGNCTIVITSAKAKLIKKVEQAANFSFSVHVFRISHVSKMPKL